MLQNIIVERLHYISFRSLKQLNTNGKLAAVIKEVPLRKETGFRIDPWTIKNGFAMR
jgi:hypothetical protein